MSALTEENVRAQKDPKILQEICLTLIKVKEKETTSKNKYKQKIISFQQVYKEKELELSCAQQQVKSLQEMVHQIPSQQNDQIEALNIKCASLQSILDSQNLQNVELLDQNKKLNQQLTDSKNEYIQFQQKMNLEIEKLQIEIQQKDAIISSINSNTSIENTIKEPMVVQNLSLEPDVNQEQMNEIQKENEELKIKITSQQTLIETIQKQIYTLTEKLNQSENKLLLQIQTNEHVTNQNDSLQQELSCKQSQINEIQILGTKLEEENQKFKSINSDQENTIKEQNEKIENLRKVISRMTDEQNHLVSIIETNNQKAKQQIAQLKIKIKEINDQSEKEKEQNIEEKTVMLHEKQELQEKIETLKNIRSEKEQELEIQLKNTIKQQESGILQLKDQIELLEKENSEMINDRQKKTKQIQENENQLAELKNENENLSQIIHQKETQIHELDTNNCIFQDQINLQAKEINELRQRLIISQEENKEIQNSIHGMEQIMTNKDETISKLKILLGRSLKTEQRSQDTIQGLNQEINNFHTKIAELSLQIIHSSEQNDHLSNEIKSLQKEIEDNEKSNEQSQKIQKLTQLLEKSNEMYLNLQKENQKLNEESSKRRSFSQQIVHLHSNDITIESNNQHSSDNKDDSVMISDKIVTITYLRRVLLQFFTDEESNRTNLIPMILDLVGCTKEQQNAVLRQYLRSTSLIAKTSSVLGY